MKPKLLFYYNQSLTLQCCYKSMENHPMVLYINLVYGSSHTADISLHISYITVSETHNFCYESKHTYIAGPQALLAPPGELIILR